jgi:hypothetical protein
MPHCEALNSRGEPCAAPDAVVDPDTRRCPAHAEGGREEMRARMGAQATPWLPMRDTCACHGGLPAEVGGRG